MLLLIIFYCCCNEGVKTQKTVENVEDSLNSANHLDTQEKNYVIYFLVLLKKAEKNHL